MSLAEIYGINQDWEIVYEDIDKLYDPALPKFQSPKLDIYIKKLENGDVFPPIAVTEENKVIDGTHRLNAFIVLKRKQVPIIRSLGKGEGKIVRDEVYKGGEFCRPADLPTCFICNNTLEFVPKNGSQPSPGTEFPQGFPVGPFYFCRLDKIIINEKMFTLWHPV